MAIIGTDGKYGGKLITWLSVKLFKLAAKLNGANRMTYDNSSLGGYFKYEQPEEDG